MRTYKFKKKDFESKDIIVESVINTITYYFFETYLSWQSSTSNPSVDFGCKNAIILLSAPLLGDK